MNTVKNTTTAAKYLPKLAEKHTPPGVGHAPLLRALLCLVITGFVLACVPLSAQGGSNYTVFGLGDLRRSVGAAYDGVGGSIYSTPFDNTINAANPALWSDVKSTRLQGGYRFNQLRVTQNGSSVGNNNGKLDGAAVVFALDTTEGISASIGIYPSSSVNYLFTKNVRVALPDSGQYIQGTSAYGGSGGLNTGFLGASWALSSRVSVGFSGLFHFGVITDKVETSLQSEGALNSITTNLDQLSAMGFTLGVQTRPAENLTIGGSLTINGSLTALSDLNYRTAQLGGAVTYDSTISRSITSSMPSIFGVGASYRKDRLLFTGDAELQVFNGMTYRTQAASSYEQATRFSIGLSRLGSRSAGASYGDKMNLNVGLGMKSLYYSFFGNQITEQYGSVGVQMPFGGAAMVDAALVLGARGSTNNGGVQEMFARLSVTISVGEVWFVPFRREQ